MKAQLTNYRQSPRKVRLVADLVRGEKVEEALRRLQFLTKRVSAPLAKLIRSAEANARQANPGVELVVKAISVDKGVVYKRFRAGARGSAFPLKKRTSRVVVELAPEVLKAKKLKTKKLPATRLAGGQAS